MIFDINQLSHVVSDQTGLPVEYLLPQNSSALTPTIVDTTFLKNERAYLNDGLDCRTYSIDPMEKAKSKEFGLFCSSLYREDFEPTQSEAKAIVSSIKDPNYKLDHLAASEKLRVEKTLRLIYNSRKDLLIA